MLSVLLVIKMKVGSATLKIGRTSVADPGLKIRGCLTRTSEQIGGQMQCHDFQVSIEAPSLAKLLNLQ